jgi:tetratricopeptide (TPR) repeat protein
VVGFTDYTKLGASGQWQFDLTSILTPTSTGVPSAARSPKEEKADNAAITQALALIDQGAYDDARQLVNDLLNENKTNAAAVSVLGQADLAEGKYTAAEREFMRAHALNPTVGYDNDAANARVLLGNDESVLATARKWVSTSAKRDEGIRVLIALTQRSPDYAAGHLLLGDAMLAAKDTSNGLMQYSVAIGKADTKLLGELEQRAASLVEKSPDSAFLRQLLGKTYLKQGRYDDAVRTLTEAKDLADDPTVYNHDLAAARVGLGRASLASGDLTTALRQFDQAKELDPTGRDTKRAGAEGLLAQAEQHARQHDYKAAATEYSQMVSLLANGGDKALRERAANGAYSVGRTLMNKRIAAGGDIAEEVGAFQAAYSLDSSDATYKQQLATTRIALGDQFKADDKLEAAAASYKSAWELFKNNLTYRDKAIEAYVTYGNDRAFNLNYTTAIEAYRQAYEMDTSNATSKQKLAGAYNVRGLDYMDQELWAKAATDFKEALALFPDNTTYQHNYNMVSPWDPNA